MTFDQIDALAWVRARPVQFFGRDTPDAIVLLAYLMADVVALGKGECVVRSVEGWWIIGSDIKWLIHPKHSMLDLFRNVVPAPAHGQHSMRGEVLLGAFGRNVAVLSDQKLALVQGDAPPAEVMAKATDLKEAILFQL